MTTKYALRPGDHSVSGDGREYIADENGQVDLRDVSPDTIAFLVQLRVVAPVFERTEAEIEAEAELARQAEEFRVRAAAAVADADALHQAEVAAIKAAEDQAKAAAEREREAAAALQALNELRKAAAVADPVVPASPTLTLDPADRAITPPRRAKPAKTDG